MGILKKKKRRRIQAWEPEESQRQRGRLHSWREVQCDCDSGCRYLFITHTVRSHERFKVRQ
jgi:hypothetical protein